MERTTGCTPGRCYASYTAEGRCPSGHVRLGCSNLDDNAFAIERRHRHPADQYERECVKQRAKLRARLRSEQVLINLLLQRHSLNFHAIDHVRDHLRKEIGRDRVSAEYQDEPCPQTSPLLAINQPVTQGEAD